MSSNLITVLQSAGGSGLADQEQKALSRYRERTPAREGHREALRTLTPMEVDQPERARARRRGIDGRDGLALERVLRTSDLFPISYLEAGLEASRPVCRIELRDRVGHVLGHGTGFLVAPGLLMTNHHVLEDGEAARPSLAQFNYEEDRHRMPRPTSHFRLDPDRFFMTHEDLDFSLVAVEPVAADGASLSGFGSLRLLPESGKALVGEYVSIIQHPKGAPKAVAIRENEVMDVFDDFLHYATDTEPGSSGSPVFNDAWDVVALHHSGVPDPQDSQKYVANEGVRISSIMRFLASERPNLDAVGRALIEGLEAGPVQPHRPPANPPTLLVEEPSEAWYKGAKGYDPLFLGSAFKVQLPHLKSWLEQDLAHAKAGGPELRYTNFSVVMSKARRLARFTAVNIDGDRLENLPRANDKWYFDPRLDRRYQCGPELYANNDLDRGHLVRRLDPVWGARASEANEDTFHFTNCAPQHKNLNQKTWLGLEDYILKNAGRYGLKVSVFTGPVFREDDLLYRGEFQIPAEFWKVVVVLKEEERLSATAYLQTQKNLLDDLEFAYGRYRTYQVPVAKIEGLTGLDFGVLRTFDPIAHLEGRMGRVIERAEDIRI